MLAEMVFSQTDSEVVEEDFDAIDRALLEAAR